jgi:ATP/maltotriose-dependent transcriptional regulator MalT
MSTLAIDEAGDDAGVRKSVAHTVRGIAFIDHGDIDRGLADLEAAHELAGTETGPLLRYSVNASDAMNLLGRYDEAVAIAAAGAERARQRGVERTSGVMLSSNTVEPLFALGQLDRAEKLLDPALALDPPPGFRVHLQRMKLWLTLWRGDVERADELVRRWRPGMLVQSEIEMQSRLGFARVAAEVAVARGDVERAWADARVITTGAWRSIPAYDLPLLAVAARALAGLAGRPHGSDPGAGGDSARGDWAGTAAAGAGKDGADATTVDVLAEAETLRGILARLAAWPTYPVWAPIVEAELAVVRAALTNDSSAVEAATEAASAVVDAWRVAVRAVASPLAPAHLEPYAQLRLAEASAVIGDRATAETAATASRARAAELGLGLIVRAADELRERALSARHSGARPTETALTDREAQVLALIEQGLSNKQIGERLYISAKTASVHVSSILKKVGAASRTEAVYRATRAYR